MYVATLASCIFFQIMVKKTRPERPDKALPLGTGAPSASKGGDTPESTTKFNPYMVKEIPDKPSSNPYEVAPIVKGPPMREKPKASR